MLLNYSTLISPSNIQAVVDLIRTFATAQGWTQNTWLTNVIWDDTTGNFISSTGNGDFLQLTSSGFGGQSIVAALYHHRTHVQPVMRTQTSYGTGTPTYEDTPPTFQNRVHPNITNVTTDLIVSGDSVFSTNWGWALKEGTMQKAWVFGNSRYICCVVDIDGVYYTNMHFGVMNLFDQSPTGQNGAISGWQAINTNDELSDGNFYTTWEYHDITTYPTRTIKSNFGGDYSRYSKNTNTAVQINNNIYYDNREVSQPASTFDANRYMRHLLYDASSGAPNSNERALLPRGGIVHGNTFNIGMIWDAFKYNGFSGRRPMYKQVYFYQRQSDSVWCPMAESYAYLFAWQGLSPGATYSYGGRQFIVFPIKDFNANIGFGFRIA